MNFTAALGGNVTVTIPLDVENVYIIKNSTTNQHTPLSLNMSVAQVLVLHGHLATEELKLFMQQLMMLRIQILSMPQRILVTACYFNTTLSNKTLTEPKFVNGGFIADANGLEMLVFDTVASALNEVKITNAATGTAGPIIASQGQTNSNLQLRPAGTGKITVGTTGANATISSNGAHDLILETNEGTNSGNITITDAANGDIRFY